MNDQFFIRPLPILIPAIMLAVYFWRCYSVRRWPGMDKCVEIIAYSSGLYAASILVPRCFVMDDPEQLLRLASFTGAVLTGLASARGAWIVLSSVVPLSQPTNIEIAASQNSESKK